MSTKKTNDTDTQKKTGEGFAEKVERLSQKASENPGNASADTDFRPVMTTANDHTEKAPEIRIIKKRSFAGWLGFLFGATALAGLGYWYQHQNGWHWPPKTAQVQPADLRTLETRLESLQQEAGALARQAAQKAIAPLQEQIDAMQAQLAGRPDDAGTPLAPDTWPDQLAALQQQLQQAQAQIAELQNALNQSQENTRQQLLQWQQRLKEQTTGLPPATPDNTQATQKLATRLRLQQALNAVESAQLALHVLRQPQGAIQALQQAGDLLESSPDTQAIVQAIGQARGQINDQQQRPDTVTPALAEIMRSIARWRWQPEQAEPANKKNWLEQLIVIKKIDDENTAAMTLAEEELLKRRVLNALNAADLAYRNGDQPAWRNALENAIAALSPHTQSQAPLAEAVGRLKELKQHDITPDWPDLTPITEQLRQHLNSPDPDVERPAP